MDTLGAIDLESIPENVDVYLDDNKIGHTPLMMTDVDSGVHNCTLSYPNYQDITFDIEVKSCQTYKATVNMDTGDIKEEYKDFMETTADSTCPSNIPRPSVSGETRLLLKQLQLMNDNIVQNNTLLENVFNSLNNLTQYIGKNLGFDEKETKFNTGDLSISVATPNIPDTLTIANSKTIPPSPGYDLVSINTIIHRNSPKVYIHNKGSTYLYVLISTNGQDYKKQEYAISRGAVATFTNVYDILIRGPKVGNLDTTVGTQPGGIYSVSENPSQFNYSNLNKPAIFVNGTVDHVTGLGTVPVKGAGFAFVTITGDILNLQSVFRSSLDNTDPIIYYTYQGADLTFASRWQLGTLGIGDKLEPNGTRGLTVYFASKSIPNQIIEVTTDTDLA